MASKHPIDDGDAPPAAKRQQRAPSHESGFPLSCFENRSAWGPSDVAARGTLPPLPPLPRPANPKLEAQALMHSSMNHVDNYEQLEWLGDAMIQAVSSNLIYLTFGSSGLKPGRLSQIRELLVRNKTLGKYAREYGLESRIVLGPEILQLQTPKAKELKRTKDALMTIEKIHGDVFEAYVGAIHVSDPKNSANIIVEWLKALWARELQDELRKLFRNSSAQSQNLPGTAGELNPSPAPPPAPNFKTQLSQAIVCRASSVEYKDMPGKARFDKMGHPLFAVGAYFSGWGTQNELLAVGSALKKSEAGSRAAELALDGTKKIKKYAEKKQAYLKAREEAGGGEEKKQAELKAKEEAGKGGES